jgi:hypothetical protein
MQGAHIYFKMPFVKFEIFFLFKFFLISEYYYIIYLLNGLDPVRSGWAD